MTSESMDVDNSKAVLDSVKEYYGKVLSKTQDLKTNVCTVGKTKIPQHVLDALRDVHQEVKNKYYGCGTVMPECLDGVRVLDLGSGSGQDCYVLSKLVGAKGEVVGLDMTDEQLEVARKYIDYHTKLYGYSKPNIRFVKGYMEGLSEAGLKEGTVDIIVSNCVVNLSPNKRAVLAEAYRVLKVGGEMYFSDVYAEKPVPDEIRKHKVLWGECVAGALWWEDLMKLTKEIGFSAPRIFTAFTYNIGNKELEAVLGDRQFGSVTYRLFKPPATPEGPCKVTYKGSIKGHEDSVSLDHYNQFKAGETVSVDDDVATILKTSRLKEHFTFQSCGGGACCTKKDVEMNPFKIAAELGNTPTSCGGSKLTADCCGPKPAGGCCAPKPADGCCAPKPAGGCCAPKPAGGCCSPKPAGGCCAPKPTDGCCAPKPAGGCCSPKPPGGCCAPKSNGCGQSKGSGGCC